MLKTRQRPHPSCPLCRSPAPRACKVSSLVVDADCAARVRQSVGFSAYTAQRRKLWSAAAEAPEELKAMPIYCTALKPRQLRAGRRLGLRFVEPRYWEIVKRAMAPGGTRRFAAVTRESARGRENEIAIGAKGCLCEILESTEGEDGIWNVIVETAAACKVLSVHEEDMHRGPPLIIGKLEELEEDEQDDDGEDGNDSEAVVLGEEGQLELLRERVQLLELLNAAMELEQARLEQRRLELTMLLSQRRLYQELIEMQSEVADLVGLSSSPSGTTGTPSSPVATSPSRASVHRRNPEGTSSASAASSSAASTTEQWRQQRASRGASRQAAVPRPNEISISSHQPHRSTPVPSHSGTGEAEFHSLMSLTRRSFESVSSSVANVLGTRGSRASSAAAEPSAQQQSPSHNSRGSSVTNSQRGLTTSDAMRRSRGGGTLPGSRTTPSSVPASSAAASLRGLHLRGGRSSAS